MIPAIHNLPEHQSGTSWGYEFDFSDFGETYLALATARLVVIDAAGGVRLDLTTGAGLTIAAAVLKIDRFVVTLEPGEYQYGLRLRWPSSGEVVDPIEGRWEIRPSKVPAS